MHCCCHTDASDSTWAWSTCCTSFNPKQSVLFPHLSSDAFARWHPCIRTQHSSMQDCTHASEHSTIQFQNHLGPRQKPEAWPKYARTHIHSLSVMASLSSLSASLCWVSHGNIVKPQSGWLALLQVNTAGCPDPSTMVTLGIGHLKSYERMGQALVSCVSGCTCNPTVFDGHNPASLASQEFWAYVAVSQSEQCVFEVASLTATKSGQNKVKVTSLLLTCMDPEDAHEIPIFKQTAAVVGTTVN
jgi:hypothetical protein